MSIRCPYCGNSKVIKYGSRKSRKGRVQRYLCKICKKYFSERTSFSHMKRKKEIIDVTFSLYCNNISLRKISIYLEKKYNVKISHVTILKWIRNYFGKT